MKTRPACFMNGTGTVSFGASSPTVRDRPRQCTAVGATGRLPRRSRPSTRSGRAIRLLAGLVDGWLNQMEPEALLRHALGCAVANAMVWDAGAIDPAEVARWAGRIEIESIAQGN